MFARWAAYLSSFDFDIEHRPGKQNLAADALTRTVFPNQPGDPDDPDSFLVYPDIEDVYNIENNSAEWTLEYNYPRSWSSSKLDKFLLMNRGGVYL